MTPRLSRLSLFALLLPTLAACQGIAMPHHGGGKRFYPEQELISGMIRSAVETLDFAPVSGRTIQLRILAVGDEGGGTVAESGLLGALVGSGTALDGAAAAGATPTVYQPHAFANARDLDVLKGRVLQALARSGVRLDTTGTDDVDGTVYVIVDSFGTKRWGRDFIVFREDHLSGRIVLDAFFASTDGDFLALGEGSSAGDVEAEYFFGFLMNEGPTVEIDHRRR